MGTLNTVEGLQKLSEEIEAMKKLSDAGKLDLKFVDTDVEFEVVRTLSGVPIDYRKRVRVSFTAYIYD